MVTQQSVFFHEDDYCQLEIVPAQSLSDLVLSTLFLKGKMILLNDYESVIKKHALCYFEKTYTGYGSTYQECRPNIRAYGFENYVVFFEFNESIVVRSWISYHRMSEAFDVFPDGLKGALNEIGNIYDLILIDHREFLSVNLKNKEDLSGYLEK